MKMFNKIWKTKKTKVSIGLIGCSLLLLTLLVSGCSNSSATTADQPAELLVGAAPSLKGSLEELKKMYSAKHPQVAITYTYGSSGSLQTQIEQGAAMDIFISQGASQMDALEKKALLKKDSRVNLLSDELVLIVNKSNTTINNFEDLTKPDVKKIGIGEATSVPAAKTTQETLVTLNLWDTLQSKLVIGKDLTQVMTYVETGDAEAGFVWDTIAITSDKVKVVATASAESHKPIFLPVAVVAASKNIDAASKFMEYLKSDEATKIFQKNGFIKAK